MKDASAIILPPRRQIKPPPPQNIGVSIDITGQRFGRLVAIKRAGRQISSYPGCTRTLWQCKCDCGNKKNATSTALRQGHTRSCGCLYREMLHRPKPKSVHPLPFGRAARNAVMTQYKRISRNRKSAWALTDAEFDKLIYGNCHYCGCPPLQRGKHADFYGHVLYNGIDRVDNSAGYVPGNVVSCCYRCNRAKNTMTVEDFLSWAKRLATYQKWIVPLCP